MDYLLRGILIDLLFGFTLISDFLLKYQVVINILGGGFVLFMGIRLLIKKDDNTSPHIPGCVFLFRYFGGCRTATRNIACKRCFCRYLYLVGNTIMNKKVLSISTSPRRNRNCEALAAKKPSVVSFTMTPIPLHKKC